MQVHRSAKDDLYTQVIIALDRICRVAQSVPGDQFPSISAYTLVQAAPADAAFMLTVAEMDAPIFSSHLWLNEPQFRLPHQSFSDIRITCNALVDTGLIGTTRIRMYMVRLQRIAILLLDRMDQGLGIVPRQCEHLLRGWWRQDELLSFWYGIQVVYERPVSIHHTWRGFPVDQGTKFRNTALQTRAKSLTPILLNSFHCPQIRHSSLA